MLHNSSLYTLPYAPQLFSHLAALLLLLQFLQYRFLLQCALLIIIVEFMW